RQHAADAERAAAAQEYLKAQAGGAQGTGRPPERARLQAARARLARLQAKQLEKIESWNHRVAQARAAGRRGLNSPGPTSLQDNAHVRRARTALQRAEQAERERQDKQQGQCGDQGDLTPAGRNITDLDSRVMPTRNGWTQGYNAQNVLCAQRGRPDPRRESDPNPWRRAVVPADDPSRRTVRGPDQQHPHPNPPSSRRCRAPAQTPPPKPRSPLGSCRLTNRQNKRPPVIRQPGPLRRLLASLRAFGFHPPACSWTGVPVGNVTARTAG
ncbi:MAG: hypothetical protein WCG47_26750, partial [Dermatophilaceae bacterium]